MIGESLRGGLVVLMHPGVYCKIDIASSQLRPRFLGSPNWVKIAKTCGGGPPGAVLTGPS